jgi:uncharacterized delta-60 repeat protein
MQSRDARARAKAAPAAEVLEPRWLLAAGDLDPTFGGGDGIATAHFPGSGVVQDSAEGVAVLPDGRVLLAGTTGNGSNIQDSVALARFTPQGVLDPTFNGDGNADGMVSYYLGGAVAGVDADVNAVALQADGKIVVVGSTRNQDGSNWDWLVMRFNPDGSRDATFGGGDGIVTRDFGYAKGDTAYSVAIQSDGKIVVTGIASQATSNLGVCRFNPDGTLDAGFSGDGVDAVDFFGGTDFASDVIVDPDGKIVVAGGSIPTATGSRRRFVLLRYLPNGTLDSTFDGDGKVATDFGATAGNAMGREVLRQPDGKYVVGGLVGASNDGTYALARYTAAGTLDPTFGTNTALPGTTLVPAAGGYFFANYGIARQSDGKLLFGGYLADPANTIDVSLGVLRLTAAGAPDTTFGAGGIRRYSPIHSGHGSDVAVAPDGEILVSGGADLGVDLDFAVLRRDPVTIDHGGVALNGSVLTVAGTPGNDVVTLSSDGKTFTAVLNGVPYTYAAAGVSSISVDLKGGDDALALNGGVPGGSVALGAGNDALTLNAGNRTGPALAVTGDDGNDTLTARAGFATPTTFDGGAGADTLAYYGAPQSAFAGDDRIAVSATQVSNRGADVVTYSALETVRAMGDSGYDQLSLTGTAAGTTYYLDGGDQNDSVFIGNAAAPGGFGSPIFVSGGADGDQLTFDGSGDAAAAGHDFTITPTTISRTGPSTTVTYDTILSVYVYGGDGANRFAVTPSVDTNITVAGHATSGAAPWPITPGDDLTVDLGGLSSTYEPLGSGKGRYSFFGARKPVEFSLIDHDFTAYPPRIVSFAFDRPLHQEVRWQFSEDVSSSLQVDDLVLRNVTTGQTVPASDLRLIVEGAGLYTTARWSPVGLLPDGYYEATLPADRVVDIGGHPLANALTGRFSVLNGDANADGVVNFGDLLTVAKNYNRTGAVISDGDFNYDKVVNFSDLLILAKAYNKTLPAPAAPPVETVAPAAARATANAVLGDDDAAAKPVFSTTRVAKPVTAKPAPVKAQAVANPKAR